MIDRDIFSEKKEYKKIEYFIKKDARFFAFYYIFSNKIIITNKLYSILNENELYAILAHEEGHKKDRSIYLGMIFFGFICFISILTCISFLIFYNFNLLLLVILSICVVILFLLLELYKYLEFKADEYSSKKINYKYLVSGLYKQRKREKYDEILRYKIIERLTKPNFIARIKRLKKINKSNNNKL